MSAFRIFILILLSFLLSTCRKASNYPFDLTGVWYCTDDPTVCKSFIEIKSDYSAQYGAVAAYVGCGDGKNWKGKARYNKSHFYIGATKFKWVSHPIDRDGTDSLHWSPNASGSLATGVPYGDFPILAEMKLKSSFWHGLDIKTFYKIVDYP